MLKNPNDDPPDPPSSHTAYKLVDRDYFSRRGESGKTRWPIGGTVSPTGEPTHRSLRAGCGPGVLHGYISPEVAELSNPIHAMIDTPRLLEIESDQPWRTDGLKRWTTGVCRVIRELDPPMLDITSLIAWAICLAPHESTREWAVRWLSGDDRSSSSAYEAWKVGRDERVAWAAVSAAACAAACGAEWAAACASRKAPIDAAWAAVSAADAASWSAERTGWVAWRAAATTAQASREWQEAEHRLMPALHRARAILAGEFSPKRYDAPYEEREQ